MKISTNSYSRSYLIIPLFNIIIKHIDNNISAKGGGITARIRKAAMESREKLDQYYQKTNIINMICTVLDPRRKLHYFTKIGFSEEKINEAKLM